MNRGEVLAVVVSLEAELAATGMLRGVSAERAVGLLVELAADLHEARMAALGRVVEGAT